MSNLRAAQCCSRQYAHRGHVSAEGLRGAQSCVFSPLHEAVSFLRWADQSVAAACFLEIRFPAKVSQDMTLMRTRNKTEPKNPPACLCPCGKHSLPPPMMNRRWPGFVVPAWSFRTMTVVVEIITNGF